MFTISQLANRFGLSRSALIHYDKIGLLKPSGRDDSNYRLYTEDDVTRLERICILRDAGVSLDSIRSALSQKDAATVNILEQRLKQIAEELSVLHKQQYMIAELMTRFGGRTTKVSDKERWISIFREIGMDDATMKKWHTAFERHSPGEHLRFLESLGLPQNEVDLIRKRSGKSSRKARHQS
ncbi:MAG TPA: MerR family transcriptional regulator [Spirochaetota bacterium]